MLFFEYYGIEIAGDEPCFDPPDAGTEQSSKVSRLRHLETVLTLIPSSRLNAALVACDRCIAALTACVVVAQP